MTLAVVWLVALAISLAASLVLGMHWLLGRRWNLALLVASVLIGATYCLLGADAAERVSDPDVGKALLAKLGVIVLTAGVLAVHVGAVRWLVNENRHRWRMASIAILLLLQVAVASIAGWRFQDALAATAARTFTGATLDLVEIPGEGLITDRGRIVPVYRVKDPLSQEPAQAWQRPIRPGRETSAETIHSNCHGWVFTAGRYIVERAGVEMILEDNGYHVVATPRQGDVIVYRNPLGQIVHTGLVRAADEGQIWIESKWGVKRRYIHRPDETSCTEPFAYYRTERDPEWLRFRSPHLVNIRIEAPTLLTTVDPYGEDPDDRVQVLQLVDLEGCPVRINEDLPIGAE